MYELDFTINRDIDRVQYISDLLSTFNYDPREKELEMLASYILYGKDENGDSTFDLRYTYDANTRRYQTHLRKQDKLISTEEIKPESEIHVHAPEKDPYVQRKYTISRKNPEDAAIPGMRQLWDSIDRISHLWAVSCGRIAPQPGEYFISNPRIVFHLYHHLVQSRFDQYLLREMFYRTIPHAKPQTIGPTFYDWDSDSFYWIPFTEAQRRMRESYDPYLNRDLATLETRTINGHKEAKWVVRRHTFDWENHIHVRNLMEVYSALWQQAWDYPCSDARCLILDFDHYVSECGLSPVRDYMLTRHIDGASCSVIQTEIIEKFNVIYSINTISNVIYTVIPKLIAAKAKRRRLLIDTPASGRQMCARCKRFLPRNPMFFAINRAKVTGFLNICKECGKSDRVKRGEQITYDRRCKAT